MLKLVSIVGSRINGVTSEIRNYESSIGSFSVKTSTKCLLKYVNLKTVTTKHPNGKIISNSWLDYIFKVV